MNKKLLLCFWGHRVENLNIVIEQYKKKFENYTIDLLISTWDNVILDNLNFKYVIQHSEPDQIYLDKIKFPYTNQIKPSHHNFARIGHFSLFFHSYSIMKYIKENNLNYDVIVKTRCDLLFTTDFEFNFDEDKIFVPKNLMSPVGINDQFICGKLEYLLKSIYFENFEDVYHFIDKNFNPEEALYKIIKSRNILFEEFYFDKYILLPNRVIK